MTFLIIVVRVLVILMILRFVMRLIAGARSVPSRGPRPKPMAERTGGILVRDPNCGTFIPESRAITIGKGPGALHFCSPACRDAYSTRNQGATSGSALRTP